jgi:hypothetical protein
MGAAAVRGWNGVLGKRLVKRAFPHDDLVAAKEAEDLTAEERAEGLRNFDVEFVNPPPPAPPPPPPTALLPTPPLNLSSGSAAQYHVTFFEPKLGINLDDGGGGLPRVSKEVTLPHKTASLASHSLLPLEERGAEATLRYGDRLVSVNGASILDVQAAAAAKVAAQGATSSSSSTPVPASVGGVTVAVALIKVAGRPVTVGFLPAERWEALNGNSAPHMLS